MAIQLSIDEEGRRNQRFGQEGRHSAVALRVAAKAIAIFDVFGRVAMQTLEKIRSTQAGGSKRKQMKLVESLSLGNRRQLLLVVCDNQRYLVGAGADNVGSILAVEASAASRGRALRGPELVRRRGRDANQDARSRAAAEAGPDLWH